MVSTYGRQASLRARLATAPKHALSTEMATTGGNNDAGDRYTFSLRTTDDDAKVEARLRPPGYGMYGNQNYGPDRSDFGISYRKGYCADAVVVSNRQWSVATIDHTLARGSGFVKVVNGTEPGAAGP